MILDATILQGAVNAVAARALGGKTYKWQGIPIHHRGGSSGYSAYWCGTLGGYLPGESAEGASAEWEATFEGWRGPIWEDDRDEVSLDDWHAHFLTRPLWVDLELEIVPVEDGKLFVRVVAEERSTACDPVEDYES